MLITVVAIQLPLGEWLTLEDTLYLMRRRPDFVSLPEYAMVHPSDRHYEDSIARRDQQLERLSRLSHDLRCVLVGGTIPQPVPGGYANVATVFNRGAVVGSYRKVNPYGHEEERGIIAGTEYRVFDVEGVRIGILICADVLNGESFATMERLGAEVIFVPTVSPFRENDTLLDKERRDAGIFVAGAQKARAYVVKTCGIGTLFGGRLQGRSGIFAPWGILGRVTPDREDKKLVLTGYLDIDEIREFKRMMAPTGLHSADNSAASPPDSQLTLDHQN